MTHRVKQTNRLNLRSNHHRLRGKNQLKMLDAKLML